MTPNDILDLARRFVAEHHPDCDCALAAGSLLRGEGTATSDLDLVVLHSRVPYAYRSSVRFQGMPVEVFVHDPETAAHFFAEGRRCGVPSLAAMIREGVEIPAPTGLSARLKEEARACLQAGPAPWSESEREDALYALSDVCDDLRAPRGEAERTASACRLYPALADYWLRTRALWSATGKSLPGRLRQVDPGFAERYVRAFSAAFAGDSGPVLELASAVMGASLFDGYRRDAAESSRVRVLVPDSRGEHEGGLPPFAVRPWPVLTTARLVLRLAGEADVPAIVGYLEANRERLSPFEPTPPEGYFTRDFWRKRVGAARDEFQQERALRLWLFLEGQPIGTCNFSQIFRGPFQACYLGYALDGAHEGKGFMREALERALDYVFNDLKLHRVMANYLPDNQRSERLLQSLGFRVEGRAPDYLRIDGEWREHVLTARTASLQTGPLDDVGQGGTAEGGDPPHGFPLESGNTSS